jgi:hypothetical protein
MSEVLKRDPVTGESLGVSRNSRHRLYSRWSPHDNLAVAFLALNFKIT